MFSLKKSINFQIYNICQDFCPILFVYTSLFAVIKLTINHYVRQQPGH